MNPYLVSWFFREQYLGAGLCPPLNRWGSPRAHNHNAYYCPDCGEVWARIVISHPSSRWYFIPRRCEKHGPPFLLQYDEVGLNNTAPLSVWAREFLIAMEWYEKANRKYDIYLICSGI